MPDAKAAAPPSPTATPATPATSPPAAPPLKERLVTTEHKLKVGRRTLEYTATCGTLVLREDEAEEIAAQAARGVGGDQHVGVDEDLHEMSRKMSSSVR